LRTFEHGERHFDAVLCSTFVDLAVFRALAGEIKGWNRECRYLCYFHENQFAYSGGTLNPADYQFASINFNSALVADAIAFNSHFNRTTFLELSSRYLKQAVDFESLGLIDDIAAKSCVLYPGMDFTEIDQSSASISPGEPLLIWNHRWEQDKGPEEFFAALFQLVEDKVVFTCALLGQNSEKIPDTFGKAMERLGSRCIHFGYEPDRVRYAQMLSRGRLVVSTARHEFFGYAVLEAVRAGCRPVLPARLSYPELFDAEFLYQEGCLAERLKEHLVSSDRLGNLQRKMMTERFSWPAQKEAYAKWLDL